MPEAEIHFLTKPAFSEILQNNPYIDRVWKWVEAPASLVRELKNQRFDYVLDLHHNLRSARVKWLLGVKSYSFNKLNIEKYLYVNFRLNRLPDKHIVDRYMETVKTLGIVNDQKGLDFFISPADDFSVAGLPQSHQSGYVALVIGALKATKQLPVEKLIELCRLIKFPIVLLGGAAEKATADLIMQQSGDGVYNLCGKLRIGQSASVIQKSGVVVTHDTGLMHIAAAFHKPIISIWGNTTPEFGMYPYLPAEQDKNVQSEVKGLSCRPCSKIGFSACPKGHFRCMIDQDLRAISKQIGYLYGHF